MKKHFRIILFCLAGLFTQAACSQIEDTVAPLENCDMVATVQMVPGCGLLLVQEQDKKIIPLNAQVTTNAAGMVIYKINGFEVFPGQQVIVGYKVANVEPEPSPCNYSGYFSNPLVNITCIVSIEKH